MAERRKIVVLGTGYVGLPAALLLAKAGHDVIGVDINENIVRAINDGVLHINEAKLQTLMDDPDVRRNLRAQSKPCEADIFLIAVPTPLDPQKKVADLTYVRDATESILPVLRSGNLLVLESTVPPLTCRRMLTPLIERTGLKVGQNVFLAHCPERILPGDIFQEIVYNDRIIGCADPTGRELAREMYAAFVKGELLETDDVTAELCKLMENAYRDVNIALANEFAAVAEELQIDPLHAIALANRHPRVHILKPGIGVGGHCIPIDPWFIKEVVPAHSRLIFASRLVNDERPGVIAERIRRSVRASADPKIVAIGAAYKANADDVRESPSVEVVRLLRADGYDVAHYDPLVQGMEYGSLVQAAAGADLLVVLVEHEVVRAELDRADAAIRAAMRHSQIMRFYPAPAPALLDATV